METLVSTTILSSGIRDIYNSIKTAFTHEHTSLNNLLKRTDIIARLQVAESFVQENESSNSNTMALCLSHTHQQIEIVNKHIEDITDVIMEFNNSFWRFGRTPNIDHKLSLLEQDISVLNIRINTMLKLSHS